MHVEASPEPVLYLNRVLPWQDYCANSAAVILLRWSASEVPRTAGDGPQRTAGGTNGGGGGGGGGQQAGASGNRPRLDMHHLKALAACPGARSYLNSVPSCPL